MRTLDDPVRATPAEHDETYLQVPDSSSPESLSKFGLSIAAFLVGARYRSLRPSRLPTWYGSDQDGVPGPARSLDLYSAR